MMTRLMSSGFTGLADSSERSSSEFLLLPRSGGACKTFNIASQLGVQTFAAVTSAVYSMIVSFVLLKVVDVVVGLRVHEEDELSGLDLVEHGEVGYDL